MANFGLPRLGCLRKHPIMEFASAVVLGGIITASIVSSGVFAGGGVGSGGSGGSGDGGHQSRYGYGWYLYDTNGSGPSNGFRSGSWSSVQNTCRGASSQVAVFVVGNSAGLWKGYNYEGWTSIRTGPGWITVASAKAAYDALDPSLKAGFTWGKNVGWFCYGSLPVDPPAAKWSVSGQSRIRLEGSDPWLTVVNNARPGQRLQWSHTLKNDGPDNMDKNVSYGVNPGGSPSGVGRGNVSSAFINQNGPSHLVTQDDVGKSICQSIWWNPTASSNGNTSTSAQACANVPHDYDLRPRISLSRESIAEGETAINAGDLSASITNNNITRTSNNIKYGVVRFAIRGNDTLDVSSGEGIVSTGANWACGVIAGLGSGIDAATCQGQELSKQTDQTVGSAGMPSISLNNMPNDISSMNLNIGDRLCYATVVSGYGPSVNSDTFRYVTACARVAKRPKVQFWGADIRTEASVSTGITRRGDVMFGSWAEYGIFAKELVRSSSGAGLSGGPSGRVVTGGAIAQSYNRLTFANSPSLGQFGDITKTTISPIFTAQGTPLPTGVHSIEGLVGANSRTQWSAGGDIQISGGMVPSGKTIIINSTGTVRIAGNVTYADGPYTDSSQIPQLIIVARNIIIEPAVTEVNAWLLSSGGYVSTCGDASAGYLSGITSAVCNQQLKINGPVLTDHLYLRRTAGSDVGNPSTPAEIFNLRPDAYLWAYGTTRDSSAIKTMYLQELPTRF